MPSARLREYSTVRSAATRIQRSAATRIQRRVRGKQTRKKTNALMRDKIDKRNLEITKRNLEIANRNSEIDNQCAICLAEVQLNDPITSLLCGHRFHTECIQIWLQRGGGCPLCRGVIPTPTMTYEEAKLARTRATEERRLATQAYTNALARTSEYERSNRSRRLRGVNAPAYIRLLQVEEDADEAVRRSQANVEHSMDTIRLLSSA